MGLPQVVVEEDAEVVGYGLESRDCCDPDEKETKFFIRIAQV